MNSKILSTILTIVLMITVSPNISAQLTLERLDSANRANNADQTQRDPINLIDNVWWVGHSEVGAFLITTPEGHILMDPTSPEQVHWVVEAIVKAGFHLGDIKYIINSHPHEEHVGGLAALQRLLPEAKIIASKETAAILASGGKTDFRNIIYPEGARFFEPVKVDGTIGHLEELTLGGTTLVAHITGGHTPGTTTWSMKVNDNGKEYNAVYMGGMSASGVERASSIELDKKLGQVGKQAVNPFVDPEGCAWYIEYYEKRYLKQLNEEKAAMGIR